MHRPPSPETQASPGHAGDEHRAAEVDGQGAQSDRQGPVAGREGQHRSRPADLDEGIQDRGHDMQREERDQEQRKRPVQLDEDETRPACRCRAQAGCHAQHDDDAEQDQQHQPATARDEPQPLRSRSGSGHAHIAPPRLTSPGTRPPAGTFAPRVITSSAAVAIPITPLRRQKADVCAGAERLWLSPPSVPCRREAGQGRRARRHRPKATARTGPYEGPTSDLSVASPGRWVRDKGQRHPSAVAAAVR